MGNWLFRVFLAFNSTSLLLVVYLIKCGITLPLAPPYLLHIPNYVSYLIYIFGMIVLTFLSIQLAENLEKESFKIGDIINVEYANDAFLPSYLGYFFVSLDIPNSETLWFVYPLIFLFTFLSQTLYFNPLFLFFNYHFYNITTHNNVRVFLITRRKIKIPKEAFFPELLRINDYTYIDNEK